MDVFYYWKHFESDLANARLGWLISQRRRMGLLDDRHPGFIWAFRTPRGRKGELQVIAKLEWMDTRPKGVSIPAAASAIYYDPASAHTVRFCESDTDDAIDSITSLIRRRFPRAFSSNFQGDNGLQVLEVDAVRELDAAVKGLPTVPLV